MITGYVHPARVGGSPRVGETAEGSGAAGKGAAATCAGGVAEEEAGYVSGARLCGGLNRQDLAELLGTPGEVAKSASGDGGSVRLSDSEGGPGVPARVLSVAMDAKDSGGSYEVTCGGRGPVRASRRAAPPPVHRS
ncbi:DUF6215 domain-containing protein [Streptomyces sp. NPDC007044]|uniref:DUF6215 domain-containing protein n=1 Tax=Streptomyces sp. NPDC007044 TaxID=3156911 RepID=UPI003454D56C